MKYIKSIILSLLIVPFLAFSMSGQEIQSLIDKCIDEGHTQGMVIAIITEDGTKFYKGGRLGVNDDTPMDEYALFELGSISKIFTSLLLQQMVNCNEVKKDDFMEMYLPEGVKVPSYHGKKITLEHLSNHTAGFPYVPENFLMSDPYNPWREYNIEYVYADILGKFNLPYAPGSQYQYSNISLGLLGHVLALRANRDYEDLMYERILKPLGMEDTKYNLTPDLKKRLAKAHIRNRQVPNWEINAFRGAGGLHSSVKDLSRFIEANLGFCDTKINDLLASAKDCRVPQDEPKLDVGLEWNFSYRYLPEIVYHGGETGGHETFVGFCPDKKIGVVVASNSAAKIADIGKHILNSNWYINTYRQQANLVPMLLFQFLGNYKSQDGDKISIQLNPAGHLSTLMFQKGFYPAVKLYPSSDNDFFLKVLPLDLTFQRDENNQVNGMIINYDGNQKYLQKVD
ncbi:MAG: beta-lactamase family protein [Parachlamydiales bacterium]|nr:beta-lactamase family protein [Parachlamydiales bacterium]